MADVQLLPGYGARYKSETIIGSPGMDVVGADTIDTSRCAQFAVQVVSVNTNPVGTFKVQQSFDDVNWADLTDATTPVEGAVLRYAAFSGPYGKIRFLVTDPADESEGSSGVESSGESDDPATEVVFAVVGFEMQGKA